MVKTNFNESQETAYIIDEPQESADTSIKTVTNYEMIETISDLLATSSLEKGKKIFNKCKSCHSYEKGSKSKIACFAIFSIYIDRSCR